MSDTGIFSTAINIWNKYRVWRYQRGNQNPYIEEVQTTQRPKEKVQKDKKRSTKHTYKTKDRVTRTPLKSGGELRSSGRIVIVLLWKSKFYCTHSVGFVCSTR